MLFKRSSQLILHALFQRQFSRYSKATYNSLEGMPLSTRQIIERLEAFAPLSLAETWDNVGLLVDPISEDNVETILLTNDLTERVVDEAVSIKAGLIVSYHPNIFRPLKRLTSNAWKERIVIQCIKNNIAVFSPHTTWDSVVGGVNDWLAGAFDISTVKPISPRSDNPNQGAGRILTLKCAITVEGVINRVKQRIGIPHLRLALANGKFKDSTVSSVALCAGSGSSVLNGVQADLYLTGEMLHHDILDAAQNGIHVILCNHSDSERGFLRSFRETLQKNILEGAANVVVSQFDCDPLVTV